MFLQHVPRDLQQTGLYMLLIDNVFPDTEVSLMRDQASMRMFAFLRSNLLTDLLTFHE